MLTLKHRIQFVGALLALLFTLVLPPLAHANGEGDPVWPESVPILLNGEGDPVWPE